MKIYLLKTKSGVKFYTSFQNAINKVMANVQHSVMYNNGKIVEQEINIKDESLHILMDEESLCMRNREIYKIECIVTED